MVGDAADTFFCLWVDMARRQAYRRTMGTREQVLAALNEQPCVEVSAEMVAARVGAPYAAISPVLRDLLAEGRVSARYVPALSFCLYWSSVPSRGL